MNGIVQHSHLKIINIAYFSLILINILTLVVDYNMCSSTMTCVVSQKSHLLIIIIHLDFESRLHSNGWNACPTVLPYRFLIPNPCIYTYTYNCCNTIPFHRISLVFSFELLLFPLCHFCLCVVSLCVARGPGALAV